MSIRSYPVRSSPATTSSGANAELPPDPSTMPVTVTVTGSGGVPPSAADRDPDDDVTLIRSPGRQPARSAVRFVTAISPGARGYAPDTSRTRDSGPDPGSAVISTYCDTSADEPARTTIPRSRPVASATPGTPRTAANCSTVNGCDPANTTALVAAGVSDSAATMLRSVTCWASTVAYTTNAAISTASPVSNGRAGRRT